MVRLVVLACCRRHCFHNPGNSDGRDRTYTYCYVIPADPIRFEVRLLRAFSRGGAAECSPGRKPGVGVILECSPGGGERFRGLFRSYGADIVSKENPGLVPRGYTLSPLRG